MPSQPPLTRGPLAGANLVICTQPLKPTMSLRTSERFHWCGNPYSFGRQCSKSTLYQRAIDNRSYQKTGLVQNRRGIVDTAPYGPAQNWQSAHFVFFGRTFSSICPCGEINSHRSFTAIFLSQIFYNFFALFSQNLLTNFRFHCIL